jgi:hypothetical protein
MKARGKKMRKAQCILEYLTMLTVIAVVICAYTFAHVAGTRPGQVPEKNLLGVNQALDNVQDKLRDLAHDDYSGDPVDWSEVPVYVDSGEPAGGDL